MEELGVVRSILERDFKVVIGWASNFLCPWIYLDKVERICHSIASFGFMVSWVPRVANSAVDEMAHQGLAMASEVVNKFHVIS